MILKLAVCKKPNKLKAIGNLIQKISNKRIESISFRVLAGEYPIESMTNQFQKIIKLQQQIIISTIIVISTSIIIAIVIVIIML